MCHINMEIIGGRDDVGCTVLSLAKCLHVYNSNAIMLILSKCNTIKFTILVQYVNTKYS